MMTNRSVILSFAIFFVSLIVGIKSLHAEVIHERELYEGPHEQTNIKPMVDWTAQEKYVWMQVQAGKIADLNQGKNLNDINGQREIQECLEMRIIRPIFLETILLRDPYRGALTRMGVVIKGAWFREPLDLSNANLSKQLGLENCVFESNVNFNSLSTLGVIYLQGCKFNGLLVMDSIGVNKNLFIRENEIEKDAILRSARIGGQVSMTGTTFKGPVDMNSMSVNGSLVMSGGAEFEKEVILRSSKIGGQVNMAGSTFKGPVDMSSLDAKSSLFLGSGSEFENDVDLHSSKIGGQINMAGSKFKGQINMNGIECGSSLLLNDVEFEKNVILLGAKIRGQVNMVGSTFKGPVDMDGLNVEDSLLMRDGAEFENNVRLLGAKIRGQVSMIGSTFKGPVNMDGLNVEGSLLMRDGAEFKEKVILRNARIGGQFSAVSSNFRGPLVLDSMIVNKSLLMKKGACFEKEVDLLYAKVGGQVNLAHSNFKGPVKMYGVSIGNSLLLKGAEFGDSLHVVFTRIGESLDISKSNLTYLDLAFSKIEKEFRFGSQEHLGPKWKKGARLILRNTYVGALQDLPDAWPDMIQIVGFNYSYLGGFDEDYKFSMANRDIKWMKQWLQKQEKYSPQPYEQLAAVLEKMGYEEKKVSILYAGKEEIRKRSKKLKWASLTLQKYIIGYGYHNFRAGLWACAFISIGVIFIRVSGQLKAKSFWQCLFYSVDMLLPIVELEKDHSKYYFNGLTRYYFYIHKLVGFILASFLIAGLSGLTK